MSSLLFKLATFSKSDWKDLLDFSSTSLSARQVEYNIVSGLKSQHRLARRNHFSVSYVHKALRPDLSRKAFLNILYKIEKTVNEFLAWQQLQKDNLRKKILLAEAYRGRGLFDLYNKLAEEIKSDINDKLDDTIWNSLYRLQICHEQYFSENPRILNKEQGHEILSTAIFSLNQFTSQLSSFYALAIANREKMLNEDWSSEKRQVDSLHFNEKYWLVGLFEKLRVLLYEDGSTYQELKTYLFAPSAPLAPKIQELILLHLITFVLEKIEQSKNKDDNYNELFALYEFGLTSGLFFLDNKIPIRRFNNIVDVGCVSCRLDWTRSFISEWGKKVEEKYSAETIVLANTQVDFVEGKYKEVARNLIQFKFKTFSQELRSRWTLIRCDYELDGMDKDFMKKQIRSFDRYISKNKANMSKTIFVGINNFSSLLTLLVLNENVKKLRQAFENYEILMLKSWLKKKIDEKSEQA